MSMYFVQLRIAREGTMLSSNYPVRYWRSKRGLAPR